MSEKSVEELGVPLKVDLDIGDVITTEGGSQGTNIDIPPLIREEQKKLRNLLKMPEHDILKKSSEN